MKKEIKVTIIYTLINNIPNYISEHTRRFDSKIIPKLDRDKENAKHYENDGHAQKIIGTLVNIYDRTWLTNTMMVPAEKVAKLGSLMKSEDD